MNIRRIKLGDVNDLLKIENASFPDPWSKKDWCCAIKDKNDIGYVCEIDGKIVGYVLYEVAFEEDRFEILNLAVDPDFRRQGVAAYLIKKVLSHKNYLTVDLVTSERNLDSHLFFKSVKFQAVEVLRNYYADGHDGYEFMYFRPLVRMVDQNDEACQER